MRQTLVKFAADSLRQTLWGGDEPDSEEDMFTFKGFMRPSQFQIEDEDKWSAATRTPKGYFTMFHVASDSYKTNWLYVSEEGGSEVDEEFRKYLVGMKRDWNLYEIHVMAVATARTLGRCIVARVPKRNNPFDFKLRVFIIREADVYYDDDGVPETFRPFGRKGRNWGRFNIPAEDCVLYLNHIDPLGNGFEGVPEINSIHNTLTYLVNMQHGYAKTISQRGLGLLLLKIKGDPAQIEDSELDHYNDQWGDPTQYSTMTFPEEEMEVESTPGVGAGMDLADTLSMYVKDVSSGSAVGEARLQGIQVGRITGSEIDQDNYASVLEGVQQMYDPFLVKLHLLIDPLLFDEFMITHEFKIKKDKKHQAEIMNLQASAINGLLNFITFNEAREMMDKPELGPEADIIANVYLGQFFADTPEGIVSTMGMVSSNPASSDLSQEKNLDQKALPKKKPTTTIPKLRRTLPLTKGGNVSRPGETRGGQRFGGRSKTNLDREVLLMHGYDAQEADALKVAMESPIPTRSLKLKRALKYFKTTDMGVNKINKALKDEFGSGLSNSALVELRRSI